MKTARIKLILSFSLVLSSLWLTGCGSTRTENGVTIENKANYNPLNWFGQ